MSAAIARPVDLALPARERIISPARLSRGGYFRLWGTPKEVMHALFLECRTHAAEKLRPLLPHRRGRICFRAHEGAELPLE